MYIISIIAVGLGKSSTKGVVGVFVLGDDESDEQTGGDSSFPPISFASSSDELHAAYVHASKVVQTSGQYFRRDLDVKVRQEQTECITR